jgi:serine/threonine protein kinase
MPKKKGGKLLGQGSYGCVFDELECNTKAECGFNKLKDGAIGKDGSMSKSLIGKIFNNKDSFVGELEKFALVRNVIDPKGIWSIPFYGYCAATNLGNLNEINKCTDHNSKELLDKRSTYPVILQKKGGDSLDKARSVTLEELKMIKDTLMKAAYDLATKGYAHTDIKLANVLLSEDRKSCYLIDYGLLRKITDPSRYMEQYGDDRIRYASYPPYPPEWVLLRGGGKDEWDKKGLAESLPTGWENEIWNAAVTAQQNNKDNYLAFVSNNGLYKVDIYSIGIVLGQLMKIHGIADSELEKDVKQMLQGDITQRMNPLDLAKKGGFSNGMINAMVLGANMGKKAASFNPVARLGMKATKALANSPVVNGLMKVRDPESAQQWLQEAKGSVPGLRTALDLKDKYTPGSVLENAKTFVPQGLQVQGLAMMQNPGETMQSLRNQVAQNPRLSGVMNRMASARQLVTNAAANPRGMMQNMQARAMGNNRIQSLMSKAADIKQNGMTGLREQAANMQQRALGMSGNLREQAANMQQRALGMSGNLREQAANMQQRAMGISGNLREQAANMQQRALGMSGNLREQAANMQQQMAAQYQQYGDQYSPRQLMTRVNNLADVGRQAVTAQAQMLGDNARGFVSNLQQAYPPQPTYGGKNEKKKSSKKSKK